MNLLKRGQRLLEMLEERGYVLLIVCPRLHHHGRSPVVRQPAVVHQGAQPHFDAVLSSVFLRSDQTVNATVEIPNTGPRVFAEIVLPHPVDLKVSKRLPVPAPYHRNAVLVAQASFEKGLLCG